MACRQRRPDRELVRIGRDGTGAFYLGRGIGRGVWCCSDGGCAHDANVAQIARALRSSVTPVELAAWVALVEGKSAV